MLVSIAVVFFGFFVITKSEGRHNNDDAVYRFFFIVFDVNQTSYHRTWQPTFFRKKKTAFGKRRRIQ